jgi:hypothetical protein
MKKENAMKRFASLILAALLALSVIVSGAAIFHQDISPVGDVPTASGSAFTDAAVNTAVTGGAQGVAVKR